MQRYQNATGLSGSSDPPSDHTAGNVLIFVVFIILRREDLRNRFIRLTGAYNLQKTTAAFDDAGKRLSGLFLTLLIVNTGFGVLSGCGLAAIGVLSALLWGILAATLPSLNCSTASLRRFLAVAEARWSAAAAEISAVTAIRTIETASARSGSRSSHVCACARDITGCLHDLARPEQRPLLRSQRDRQCRAWRRG